MTDEECQPRQQTSPCLCAHLGKTALMNSLVTSACNYSSCHCHSPPSLPPSRSVDGFIVGVGGVCATAASCVWALSRLTAGFFLGGFVFKVSPFRPLSLSPVACPVLCSGNGQYDKGSCVCYSGWKGPECDVPITECIDPLCSGHGTCTDGHCVCSIGYKGQSCGEGETRHREGVTVVQDAVYFILFFYLLRALTHKHTHIHTHSC